MTVRHALKPDEWLDVKRPDFDIHDVLERIVNEEQVFEGNQSLALIAVLHYFMQTGVHGWGFTRQQVNVLRYWVNEWREEHGDDLAEASDLEDIADTIDVLLPPE